MDSLRGVGQQELTKGPPNDHGDVRDGLARVVRLLHDP